jgi:hypothetical protein
MNASQTDLNVSYPTSSSELKSFLTSVYIAEERFNTLIAAVEEFDHLVQACQRQPFEWKEVDKQAFAIVRQEIIWIKENQTLGSEMSIRCRK